MGIDPKSLSVAVGLSQGYANHLEVCLGTVPKEIPKIVSWYGPGGPDHLPSATKLVRPRQHYNNFRASYVLNVAIRAVETRYVILADADFLFPPFFFEVIEPAPDRVLRFYAGRLNQQASRQVMDGTPWHELYADYQGRANRVFSTIYGSNNPCIYPTEVLRQIRGYDERMIGWGAQDDQLTLRTRRHGLKDIRVPLIVGVLDDSEVQDYSAYERGQASHINLELLQARRYRAINRSGWGDSQDDMKEKECTAENSASESFVSTAPNT